MNIAEEVKSLGLPLEKLLVFSSGTMHVLGIREARDIDVCVTKDVYDELWSNPEWEHIALPWGGYNLKKGLVEIIPKLEWDKFPVTVNEALEQAMIVDEVRFMSLSDTKEFKKAMGREKDMKDLELIKVYEEKM